METSLEVIKSIINGSIESAREEIEFWNKYIPSMQEELNQIEHIAGSIDEIEPCPICGSQMVNLAKIIKRNPLIRHSYGGEYLKDYIRMTNNRVSPTGHECQGCGIFEKEPDTESKHSWTIDTSPGRSFASLVFRAYPFIQQIDMAYLTSSPSYLFLIDGRWYTFGELSKDEVAERLRLTSQQASPQGSPPKRIAEKGYIYLIRASTGQYKIGRTKDISSRFNFFVVKLPFEIDLIHHFEADDMRKAEAELHERYKGQRVNGEWFDLDSQDVEVIKGISEIRLS